MPNPIPGWLDAPFNLDGTQDLTHAGSPQSWNSLIMNGTRLPGLAIVGVPRHSLVSFHGRASGKGPGAPTIRGREPGVVPVEIHLRTNKEWDDFVAIAPRLLPVFVRGKGQPATAGAIQAFHPLLAAFGIRWVLVRDTGGEPPKGGGKCILKFGLEETTDPNQGNILVKQAIPKPTGLENAPTIAIAGEAPRPPNRRDFSRKPVQNAR